MFRQDPFDADEFVERLAWKVTGGVAARANAEDFDPMTLHASFEKTIRDLKDMNRRIQSQVQNHYRSTNRARKSRRLSGDIGLRKCRHTVQMSCHRGARVCDVMFATAKGAFFTRDVSRSFTLEGLRKS